jgi:hypothetical protein
MILANLSGATGPTVSTLVALTIPVASGANPEDGVLAILARCGSCPAPAPRVNTSSRDTLALPLLVDAFVDGARLRETGTGRKGNLHFLASVFANLSAVRRTASPYSTVLRAHAKRTRNRRRRGAQHCWRLCPQMRQRRVQFLSTHWLS